MATYSACGFCGGTNSPRTREHIFADWIAREFPNAHWTRIEPQTGKKVPFKNSLGLVSRRVCKNCNTGWMHKLESAIKPRLRPLIHAYKTDPITPNDQLLITRWLMKTMLAYDLNIRTRPVFYTTDERRELANSLMIPHDTYCYLSQYRGIIGQVATLESPLIPQSDLLPKDHEYLIDMHGYTGTFVIGHMALQVFSFRRPKNLIGKTLNFIVSPEWDRAALQIWPVRTTHNWPPPRLLEDLQLRQLATRMSGAHLLIN